MKRNLKEKIEKILYPNYTELSDSSKDNIKQLLTLFSDVVDEIIGEDNIGQSISGLLEERNELRKQQRARKKELGL